MKTDNATPRPWRFGRIATGTPDRVIYGANRQAVLEIPYRFGAVETRAANQTLLLRAVNAYDAHLALVEATRTLVRHDDAADKREGLEACVELDAVREALAAVERAEKGE